MSFVLDWSPANAQAVLEQVCGQLQRGHVVALPTEAGYEGIAWALNPAALTTLSRMAVSPDSISLVLGDPQEALDWLPQLRGAAVRLGRAFWPGPLILAAPIATHGLLAALPEEVVGRLVSNRRLAIRVPDHVWPMALGQRLRGPLASVPLAGFPRDVGQIVDRRDHLTLIVDNGPSPMTEPPTVVQVEGRVANVLRAGAIPRSDLDAVVPCRILFVCTGNTCRSPLAEALCRQLLSANLGCGPDELSERGYVVQSAGLAAGPGNPATAEAVAVAQSLGVALEGHRSRPVSLELLSGAWFVFTMTRSQQALLQSLGLAGVSPQLLDPAGGDVDDPIGSSEAVYVACARQLRQFLAVRLPELLEG
jgi:protein-tyrosine phosphatase